MTQCTPTVTVLMPVYNGARFLRDSIKSILNQTFTDFECLIIDDASTDTSREIIRSFNDPRIKLIENVKNCGLIKTLNRGLALAKGVYIARQDQDDISHRTRIEKQVTFLNSNPEIVLLGTRINHIDQHGKKNTFYNYLIASTELALHWQVMFDNPFIHSSVMMRAETVRSIGGYDEHFLACEDYDLFSRLLSAYKATNLPESLVDYRYHTDSMTAKSTKENNLLMSEIVRRTFFKYLNMVPSPEDIEIWLSINNPNNFNLKIDPRKLVKYIESAYDAFIAIYPDAQDDLEIKKHITSMMLRLTYNSVSKDRLASIRFFYNLSKRDIHLACKFLPKYLLMFALGQYRSVLTKEIKNLFQLERNYKQ